MRTLLTLLILFPLIAASQTAVRLRFGAGGVPSGGGGGGSFDTNGLLLVWRFDEGASGNRTSSDAYALVLTSTNNVGYSTSGVRSNSTLFSRSSNMILGMDTTNLVESSTNLNFTLTTWVNYSSFPSAGQIYGIVGKTDPGVNSRVGYGLSSQYDAASSIQLYFITGTNATGAGVYQVTATTKITDTNAWHFIAAGRAQVSGNWSNWISVDGGARDWTASPIGPAATATPFRVGSHGSATHLFNGRIDELTFWRTNISDATLVALATNPPPTLP